MRDEYDGHDEVIERRRGSSTKYSRYEGLTSYKRRRRRDRVFKAVIVLIVVAIVAGAVALFGKFSFDGLPTFTPFAQNQAESQDQGQAQDESQVVLVEPADIRVAIAGDVICNYQVLQSASNYSGAYDFSHLFSHLSPEISGFDMRALDQETGMAGDSYGYGNNYPLNAPYELGTAEVNAGFNVFLHATDHAMDTGREGIHSELLWWQNNNSTIPVLGISEPDRVGNPSLGDYVNNVYVYDKSGFKVAILNHSTDISEDNYDVVSPLTEEKIAADVAKAREQGAGMIIACPHWGNENDENVSEEETNFAQIYAKYGVDVIVGMHPRVLQRVDVLSNAEGHKTVCFYSLGCLVSGLDTNNMLGGMAELTLSRDAQGKFSIREAKLKPVVTNRSSGTDYTTYLLSDYTDEIAQGNWDGLTREGLNERCQEILGAGYNAGTCEYVVAL